MRDHKDDASAYDGGGVSGNAKRQEEGKGGDEPQMHQQPAHEVSTPELVKASLGFRNKFERSRSLVDISEAITAMQRAVDRTSDKAPNLLAMLGMLALFLGERFELTGNLVDLEDAMSNQIRVMTLIPEAHPDLPKHLLNLGNSHISRFERTGELAVLTEAISLQSRAVGLMAEAHPNLVVALNSLGTSFTLRFSRTRDLQDVTNAISNLQRAVNIAPEGGRVAPMLFDNLGNAFDSRFDATGHLKDLSEAIALHQRAVRLAPSAEDPALAVFLSNLGNSLSRRFERTGEASDLTEGIAAQNRAAGLLQDGNIELPKILSGLGMLLTMRFRRAGSLQDITEAVAVQRRGVNLTPEGDARLPAYLTNLGNAFADRFNRTGDVCDLNEAISILARAVELSPDGHSSLPGRLANLALALCGLYEGTAAQEDIDRAITIQRRAVNLIPEGNEGRASRISNLGYLLVSRFERGGGLADLEEAIKAQTLALDLTVVGDVAQPSRLAELGSSLMLRFKQTGDLRDLRDAQQKQRVAIESTTQGHASLPRLHYYHAITSMEYFKETGLLKHLSTSIAAFESAATGLTGSPRIRLAAAKLWVKLLGSEQPVPVEVIHAFDTLIRLLAFIAGVEKPVKSRYVALEEHPRISLKAAATALQLKMPEKALEWLEQGRCLVWGQQNDLRTPLEQLLSRDAALARRVMDVAKGLESAGTSTRNSRLDIPISMRYSLEDEAGRHARLAAEWDTLVTGVRKMSGFESFLQPASFSSLVEHLPPSGYVVVINVHKIRCDAIVVASGLKQPVHVPLPGLSLQEAIRHRGELWSYLEKEGIRDRGCLSGDGEHRSVEHGEIGDPSDSEEIGDENKGQTRALGTHRAQGSVRSVLRSLWVQVVKPILSALGISKGDSSCERDLPTIWWCLTGPLSFLPIHAAGEYGTFTSECLFDYAISSYTPTLSVLGRRVRFNHEMNENRPGLLLTSQPSPPGARKIPGTTKEVRKVHSNALERGLRVEMLEGEEVTAEGFLARMEEFSCVHLACHGTQNATDPLRSRFLFHKGDLTLDQIARSNLKNADLAFLSACKTSAGKETLPDEAVHLAAGMLAAGYHRVVATMWAIEDKYAPQVADDFYEYLWSHGDGGAGPHLDGSKAARALHHAIQLLRRRIDNSDGSLLAWIPYVHFGY